LQLAVRQKLYVVKITSRDIGSGESYADEHNKYTQTETDLMHNPIIIYIYTYFRHKQGGCIHSRQKTVGKENLQGHPHHNNRRWHGFLSKMDVLDGAIRCIS